MLHRITAILSFLAVLAALLVAPVSASPHTAPICFSQVPDCIDGRFAEFWQQNGGLPVFGLPKSPAAQQQAEGKTYLVQLFERNRFELHPENQPPYDVLLGLLGNETAAAPAPSPQPGPPPLPQSVNAVARPERGPRGTRFFFIANGFKPGEKIGVYITLPDQSVFGAPFQTTADKNGVSDSVVSFRPPDDPAVPTGIWAVTFEGVDSHNKAIAYFEVTER